MIVSLKGVRYSYKSGTGSLEVLNIAEWQLGKGEHVALSGPSGCGKTTLLNVIAGLLVPAEGSVEVCGVRLDGAGEAARDRFRAAHLGYIFQNFNLLQGFTAFENVLLSMTFSRKEPDAGLARELIGRVGLSDRMHHYPSQLSIGEQQRVAVARALANRPDLVLADEPTGSLDPQNSREVIRLLKETAAERGVGLIVVSHEKEVVGAFEKRVPFLELNEAFSAAGGAM
jgi:ABC-type lipoprotein export system ATPase subunit